MTHAPPSSSNAKRYRLLGLLLMSALLAGYCTKVIRPPRPLWHHSYEYHPDGRPPWPRWMIDPAMSDGTGTSVRTEHVQNTVIVVVGDNSNVYLNWHRVLDDNGDLLLFDEDRQARIAVPNTSWIKEARDEVCILLMPDHEWYRVQVGPGFAEAFESFRRQNESATDLIGALRQFARISGEENLRARLEP